MTFVKINNEYVFYGCSNPDTYYMINHFCHPNCNRCLFNRVISIDPETRLTSKDFRKIMAGKIMILLEEI